MEIQLIIRSLNTEDAQAISVLSGQLGYPATAEETTKRLSEIVSAKDHLALGALHSGELVGWIHAFKCITIESDPFIEIAGLVVNEKYRGQKIGTMLVEEAKKWAGLKGIVRIRVRSNVVRKEAHLFYNRIGFSEIKEQKVFSFDFT